MILMAIDVSFCICTLGTIDREYSPHRGQPLATRGPCHTDLIIGQKNCNQVHLMYMCILS
jgi:hypothetical protein